MLLRHIGGVDVQLHTFLTLALVEMLACFTLLEGTLIVHRIKAVRTQHAQSQLSCAPLAMAESQTTIPQ